MAKSSWPRSAGSSCGSPRHLPGPARTDGLRRRRHRASATSSTTRSTPPQRPAGAGRVGPGGDQTRRHAPWRSSSATTARAWTRSSPRSLRARLHHQGRQVGERGIGLALTRPGLPAARRRGGGQQHRGRGRVHRPLRTVDRPSRGGRRGVIRGPRRRRRLHGGPDPPRVVERVRGFEVVGSRTTVAGGAAMAELEPDLVLLDLYLPDVFGLDVLTRLRSSGEECDVMVISAAKEVDAVRPPSARAWSTTCSSRSADELRRAARAVCRAAPPAREAGGPGAGRHRPGPGPGAAPRPWPPPLPKGMSVETAELVEGALRDSEGTLSASECAERSVSRA